MPWGSWASTSASRWGRDESAPVTSDPMDVLEDLKFVQTADVYKSGLHAGRLRRHEGGVEFSYFPDYQESGGQSVATTLPVDGLRWWRGNGAVPAFFAGLLPEGRRLNALRRSVKTSADDELTLLLAVGEDAVGDVQVVPEGATPGEVPSRIEVTSFDQVEFADLFVQETGQSVDRVGLPGVQDKVSAAMIQLAGTRQIQFVHPQLWSCGGAGQRGAGPLRQFWPARAAFRS